MIQILEFISSRAESIFYTIITLIINFCIAFTFYRFIIHLEKNEKFRAYIKQGVENGDDILNFKDMAATIMLLFAVMFIWLLLDVIAGSLIFNNLRTEVIFALSTISGSLFGVGGFLKKS